MWATLTTWASGGEPRIERGLMRITTVTRLEAGYSESGAHAVRWEIICKPGTAHSRRYARLLGSEEIGH